MPFFVRSNRRPRAAGAAAVAACLGCAVAFSPLPADAQSRKAPTARAAKKPAERPAPPLPPLPEATPEQLDAAERVFYGRYECEFDQSITLHSSPKHAAYVDVTHGKNAYLMKPVLSSTGAIRLEDVRGATLMVQISAKSMLLDVHAGRRLVDECVSPKQRELVEAARQAKAAAVAAPAPAPAIVAPAASEPAAAAAPPAGPASAAGT